MKQPVQRDRAKGAEARAKGYILRLFVAGDEPNSRLAKENLTRLCDEHLKGGYEIEIVDVLEDFQTALDSNVLVAPTLIAWDPMPAVVILGDLGDTRKVLSALRLTGGES